MRDGRWKYSIRAYYPANRGLAIETVHSTAVSRDIEIEVFKTRMARGEIAYIEVISHVEPFGVSLLPTNQRPAESHHGRQKANVTNSEECHNSRK